MTIFSRTPIKQFSLVTAALLAVFGLVLPIAYAVSGATGVLVAGVSAFVCGSGAVVSLVVCGAGRRRGAAIIRLTAGMILRLSFPLVVLVFLITRRPEWIQAGLPVYLVVFYLAALVVETFLFLDEVETEGSRTLSG